MTGGQAEAKLLSQLQATLDIYGAERTRWPVAVRHALSGFISSNGEAQKLLAAAECFDRLIDQAPTASADQLAPLTDRIVAEACRQPRIVSTTETVPAQPAARWRPPWRERGVAAAVLAASLLFGILAGQTRAVDQAADLLMGDSSAATQIAQVDDGDGLLDEDLL